MSLLVVSLCVAAKQGDRVRPTVKATMTDPGWFATVRAPVVRSPAAPQTAPRSPQLN